MSITESKLVAIKWKALAAIPGESLNKRLYSKEVLQDTVPHWVGRPFLLDHHTGDVENRVVGIITGSKYGIDKKKDGNDMEGVWLEGMGLVSQEMYEKMTGVGSVPSIINAVSIGGDGDSEPMYNSAGDRVDNIKKLVPQELSAVSMAGIPEAHLASVSKIQEAYTAGKLFKEVAEEPIMVSNTSIRKLLGMSMTPDEVYEVPYAWREEPCDICGVTHTIGGPVESKAKEHDMGKPGADKIPVGTAGDSLVVPHTPGDTGTLCPTCGGPSHSMGSPHEGPNIKMESVYNNMIGDVVQHVYREHIMPVMDYREPQVPFYNQVTKQEEYHTVENPRVENDVSPYSSVDNEFLTTEEEDSIDEIFSIGELDWNEYESDMMASVLNPMNWHAKEAAKNWVKKAIKRPGALRKALGVSGDKPIPVGALKAAAKKPGRLGRMARLAIIMRGFKKRKK